jgi:phosphoribosylformylglycinamidine synthase
VTLTVENSQTLFTSLYAKGERVTLPVAHHDGNYFADGETLAQLEGEGRVVFRYAESVNGSAHDIAGIINDRGNVLGMMPHPERAMEPAHGGFLGGGTDGRRLFESAVAALSQA